MSVEEYEEALELIDTMVQRCIDYWRGSPKACAIDYVDAYRCIQENIKAIKAKILDATEIVLPIPEQGFDEHCFCNRGIRRTPNKKTYCLVHGYDYQSCKEKVN